MSAGRYPEWQASTAQLAVSRCVRGAREKAKQKESADVYMYIQSVPEVAFFSSHADAKSQSGQNVALSFLNYERLTIVVFLRTESLRSGRESALFFVYKVCLPQRNFNFKFNYQDARDLAR